MLAVSLILLTATFGTQTFTSRANPVKRVRRKRVGWTDIAIGEFPKGGKRMAGTITSFSVKVDADDQNWGNCWRGSVRLVAYRNGKAELELWRSAGSNRRKCGSGKRLMGDVSAYKLAQILPNDQIGFQWECNCKHGHTYSVNKVSGKYRTTGGKNFGAVFPIGKDKIANRRVGWTDLAVGDFPAGGKVVGNVHRFFVNVNAHDQNWGGCGRGTVRLVAYRNGKPTVQLWRSWGSNGRWTCERQSRLRGWVPQTKLALIKPTDKIGFQWECNCTHGHSFVIISVTGSYTNGDVRIYAKHPIGTGIIRHRKVGWTDMVVGSFPKGGKVLGHVISFNLAVNADDQNWGNCWRGSVRLVAYRNGKAALQLWRSAGSNRKRCGSGSRTRGSVSHTALAKLNPTDKIGFQYECACTQGHTYRINRVYANYLTTEHRRRKQLLAPEN